MQLQSLALALMTTCATATLASAALADPPGRVGRISYVEGDVSFQPPQEEFWTLATRNYPVARGEAFWTGDQGRAELQIGGVEARLDNETELDVVDLDYGEARLSLAQGSLDLRIWRAPRGGVRISTPAGEVRLDYAGLYRIDVGAPRDDGAYPPVEVTVFDGYADVPSPDGPVSVEAGEAALIDAGYMPEAADAQDAAIDDWARDRERRERWSRHDYLSPALTGFEDLDGHGDFADTAEYGQVWFPRDVPVDWAPYRYGHWAFVQPWGWTWIDDQSWGFAPFHYGRWARVNDRWGWIPGQVAAEPIYAPALVAFIGGRGWSAGVGGGEAIGWVPLAPDEVYRPTYQVSQTYIRQVNITNVRQTTINNITVNNTTVNNITVNQYRNAPAVVVVRADTFAHGASVQRAVMPVSAQTLSAAQLTTLASRPAPTPEARTGLEARAKAAGSARPAAAPVIMSAPPPPARLQAVRLAVAAQPLGASRPPPIAGATIAPPRPRPAGAPPMAFVAPSQIRNPAAQARQPAPVVHAAIPGGNAAAPGSPPVRAIPLRTLAKSPPVAGPAATPRPAASGQAADFNAQAQAAAAARAADRQAQTASAEQARQRAQAAAAQREADQRTLAAQQEQQRVLAARQSAQAQAAAALQAQQRAEAATAQREAEASQRAQAVQQVQQRAAAQRQQAQAQAAAQEAQQRAQTAAAQREAEANQRAQAAQQEQQRAAAQRQQAQAQAQAQARAQAQAAALARQQGELRAQEQARQNAAAQARAKADEAARKRKPGAAPIGDKPQP